MKSVRGTPRQLGRLAFNIPDFLVRHDDGGHKKKYSYEDLMNEISAKLDRESDIRISEGNAIDIVRSVNRPNDEVSLRAKPNSAPTGKDANLYAEQTTVNGIKSQQVPPLQRTVSIPQLSDLDEKHITIAQRKPLCAKYEDDAIAYEDLRTLGEMVPVALPKFNSTLRYRRRARTASPISAAVKGKSRMEQRTRTPKLHRCEAVDILDPMEAQKAARSLFNISSPWVDDRDRESPPPKPNHLMLPRTKSVPIISLLRRKTPKFPPRNSRHINKAENNTMKHSSNHFIFSRPAADEMKQKAVLFVDKNRYLDYSENKHLLSKLHGSDAGSSTGSDNGSTVGNRGPLLQMLAKGEQITMDGSHKHNRLVARTPSGATRANRENRRQSFINEFLTEMNTKFDEIQTRISSRLSNERIGGKVTTHANPLMNGYPEQSDTNLSKSLISDNNLSHSTMNDLDSCPSPSKSILSNKRKTDNNKAPRKEYEFRATRIRFSEKQMGNATRAQNKDIDRRKVTLLGNGRLQNNFSTTKGNNNGQHISQNGDFSNEYMSNIGSNGSASINDIAIPSIIKNLVGQERSWDEEMYYSSDSFEVDNTKHRYPSHRMYNGKANERAVQKGQGQTSHLNSVTPRREYNKLLKTAETEGFTVMKAIDQWDYSGFQHRKFRSTAQVPAKPKYEYQTGQYVKVKRSM